MPKEEEKILINEDEDLDTEWDDILAKASEEELVDLAGSQRSADPQSEVCVHQNDTVTVATEFASSLQLFWDSMAC